VGMGAENNVKEEPVTDEQIAFEFANEINEKFNTGKNKLTSIKVCVDPKYHKANIYAEYVDKSRVRGNGSEEEKESECEEYINWPHYKILENTDESWKDLSYPNLQMQRALLLSQELKTQLIIVPFSDNLKCYIKDGKAHIEKFRLSERQFRQLLPPHGRQERP